MATRLFAILRYNFTPLAVLFFFTASAAQAHTGVGGTHGLVHGLTHPVTGLDHLLAMVAVGLWAVQLGSSAALWRVPAAFLAAMVAGWFGGVSGFTLPFLEPGIAASVLLLGLLLALAFRPSTVAAMSIVAFFGLFHGWAHGLEMPVGSQGWLYSTGFILVTALLHGFGLLFGWLCVRAQHSPWLRLAGVALLFAGVITLIGF